MVLTSILLWSLIAAAGLALVSLAYLHYQDILDYFHGRSKIKIGDPKIIAFILKDHLDSGKYRVAYGFFNPQTSEIIDGECVEADKADNEVDELDELTVLE